MTQRRRTSLRVACTILLAVCLASPSTPRQKSVSGLCAASPITSAESTDEPFAVRSTSFPLTEDKALDTAAVEREGVFTVRAPRTDLDVRIAGVQLSQAHAAALKVPEEAARVHFDFEQQGIEGWHSVDGRWGVEEMPGAHSGKHVLVQRTTENAFNVIVAPPGPYTDVDVSVRFKPMAGREDASGGIVLRFAEGHYYVVRANALENNFRLYYYDRGRHQLATATVQPPALGQWHTIRVVAVGDHIQAYLNGTLLLDHRDSRYRAGQIGLWTKADSITAFDDLVIRGVPGT